MEWKTGIILEILFVFLFLLQILNVRLAIDKVKLQYLVDGVVFAKFVLK